MIAAWLAHAIQWLQALKLDDEQDAGQGLVEYALILIFVSVVVITILVVLAPGINNAYSNIVRTL